MSHDPQIIQAENVLMKAQRYWREHARFDGDFIKELIDTLELVLDKHAELTVQFEPEDFDEEDVFLDTDYDDDEEVEYLEPAEDDDFPYTPPFGGDGDHSEERGNG